jgi:cytoskeletal protein CcmA (bactofilin family)
MSTSQTGINIAGPEQQRAATGPQGGQSPQPSRNGEQSVINADLTIIGNVTSKGNVKLDGTIRGDMYCASLVVSETGSIEGAIVANNEVTILGRVVGTIHGKRVMLYATSLVQGDIFHQGIGIEMGTRYDGSLKWTDDSSAFNTQGAPRPAFAKPDSIKLGG